MLETGMQAPWFVAEYTNGQSFRFDRMAGKDGVIVSFPGSLRSQEGRQLLDTLRRLDRENRHRRISFFIISHDPDDNFNAAGESGTNFSYLLDADGAIASGFGCLDKNRLQLVNFLLDCRLRVFDSFPLDASFGTRIQPALDNLCALQNSARAHSNAPVLRIPRVFDPALCKMLIDHYLAGNPKDSGYMIDRNGTTFGILNHDRKQRTDVHIPVGDLQDLCLGRIRRVVIPEVQRAFQFLASRVERHLVGCYDASLGGQFVAHRDNTTIATSHRQFAVSIVLNAGEFSGGELVFPEYGSQQYAPETGEALVFSCSILHAVLPLVSGRRFVYLPFLYDENGARKREKNIGKLSNN